MPTSLEDAIHTRWATKATLQAALPVASVFTGHSPQSTLPYANITNEGETKLEASNRGDYEQSLLRVHVWTSTFDAGKQIMRVLRSRDAGFHRDEFSIDTVERCMFAQRVGGGAMQEEDGVWHHWEDFEFRTAR
jgi:hypothetical protein